MQYAVVRSDDYLAHFGIKGQKWGVRRYENEDGTLTEAGKKRYAKAEKVAQREKISKTQMAKNVAKRAATGAMIGSTAAQFADRIAKRKAFDSAVDPKFKIVDFNDPNFSEKTIGVKFNPDQVINTGFHTEYGKYGSKRVNDYAYGFTTAEFKSPGKADAFAKVMTHNLLSAPAAGAAIGAGVGALGSMAVDKLHNVKIDRAKKFVNKYADAYKKTMNIEKAREQRVKDYKDAHPNSKLSDKEIQAMLRNSSDWR